VGGGFLKIIGRELGEKKKNRAKGEGVKKSKAEAWFVKPSFKKKKSLLHITGVNEDNSKRLLRAPRHTRKN